MARQHAFPEFPGVSTYKDRKGETKYRFRHKLIKEVTFEAAFGTVAFAREWQQLVDQVAAKAGQTAKVVEDPAKMAHIGKKTFRHAWVLVQDSIKWAGLKEESTQGYNAMHIEAFLQDRVVPDAEIVWADAPMADVKADHLQDYYERIYRTHPSKAKHRMVAVRKLYDEAVRKKWIGREENKMKFVETLPLPETDANPPWPLEYLDMFEARHPIGSAARTCYELGIGLGSRRVDLAGLTLSQIKSRIEYNTDGSVLRRFEAIEWVSKKARKGTKGIAVYHEITERLALALQPIRDRDGDRTILETAYGKPFSVKSLTGTMQNWCRQAGIPVANKKEGVHGYTLHGLRHTLGSMLAEQGVEGKGIQKSLGHKKSSTTEHYTRRADGEKIMKNVAKVQNGERQVTVIRDAPLLKVVK